MRLDLATYARLSRAADNSRLSITVAAGLIVLGGRRGRRTAFLGLGSVTVTSVVVNLAVEPIGRRGGPDR